MNISDVTNTVDATIADVTVKVPQPFAEGHSLTEAESKVLNQVLKENLGNNVRTKIKAAIEAVGEITDEVTAQAQVILDEYVATYEFGVRSIGTSTRKTPLESRIRKLATASINAALKANDLTADKEKKAEFIDSLIAHEEHGPALKAQAEEQLAAEQLAAANVLDLGSMFNA